MLKFLNPLWLIDRYFICRFGGDSSSSSSNTTNTTNVDKRQVVDANGIGVSSDSSTVTVNNTTLDGGIVNKALDAMTANDAANGQGFTQLLNLADKMFSSAGSMVSKAQDTALSQISSINTAANDAKGAINQKTLIILAGAAAAVFIMGKK
jgi:hypothetical protein